MALSILERPKSNRLRSILGNPTSMEQAFVDKNHHNVFKYFRLVGVEKLL